MKAVHSHGYLTFSAGVDSGIVLTAVTVRMQNMAYAKSPSPPPPAPVPATPGPRASQLSTVFYNALQHTLKACTYDKFSSCFPTPALKNPDVLKSVHTQITMMIEEKAGREFDDILQEREVVAGLNDLERLVGDAKSRRAGGGPSPSNP